MENKKEIQKKQLEVLSELEDSMTLEHVIKDNTVEFKSGEQLFRVRKPDFLEVQELNNIRRKKHLEYLKDDSMLFRKQWVELYKNKGVDIDKMENDIKSLQAEMEASLLKLVKVQEPKAIGKIRKEIVSLRRKMWDINVEKTDLLEYSIEDQLLLFINSYTTYLVLEKKEDDKWVKNFKSYEDFQKCNDTDLMTKTFNYVSKLIYGEYDVK